MNEEVLAQTTLSPDQAWKRLAAGNAKFVAGELPAQTAIAERRTDTKPGQWPFAMVLSCADSRVPVEHVFDQLIGDIFVCRVAGNITMPSITGSFEYAIVNFKPVLLVVMAHERCGAVSSTIQLAQEGGTAPGSIQALVDAVAPAVKATPRGSLKGDAYTDAVAKTNAKLQAKAMVEKSEIIAKAIEAKKLKIVPAFYALGSGKVSALS